MVQCDDFGASFVCCVHNNFTYEIISGAACGRGRPGPRISRPAEGRGLTVTKVPVPETTKIGFSRLSADIRRFQAISGEIRQIIILYRGDTYIHIDVKQYTENTY